MDTVTVFGYGALSAGFASSSMVVALEARLEHSHQRLGFGVCGRHGVFVRMQAGLLGRFSTRVCSSGFLQESFPVVVAAGRCCGEPLMLDGAEK